MAIRQQLCWNETEHKFVGYCDYGNNYNIEENEIQVKEALVFMVVSLKGKWKWLIGYILKNGMLSATLAELINTALKLTAEVNLKVRSVTCDGEKVNVSAFKILGCNLFPDNHEEIVNSFPHPSENYKIYVILDAHAKISKKCSC